MSDRIADLPGCAAARPGNNLHHPKTPSLASALSWCGIMALMALAACTPAQPATPQPTSAPRTSLWGELIPIAQTRHREAPAIALNGADLSLVWGGADEIEARHYAWGRSQVAQILALKAFFPFAHKLYPAAAGYHMLWLDRTAEADDLRLQYALIGLDAVAEVGPAALDDLTARHYAAMPLAEGRLQIAYSAQEGAVSNLYALRLDATGRATIPTRIYADADYPAWHTDAAGRQQLYWLDEETGRVQRAAWRDDTLNDIQTLSATFPQETGTQLLDFFAAQDDTHMHLFWQLRTANGTPRLFWSTAPIDAERFSEPRQMTVFASDAATVDVGFNAGNVSAAGLQADAPRIAWAYPLAGQHAFLPVAVQRDDGVGVLYLHQGDVVGYQQLAQSNDLLSTPKITTDRDRNLYVTWSDPAEQAAQIYLATTRR